MRAAPHAVVHGAAPGCLGQGEFASSGGGALCAASRRGVGLPGRHFAARAGGLRSVFFRVPCGPVAQSRVGGTPHSRTSAIAGGCHCRAE